MAGSNFMADAEPDGALTAQRRNSMLARQASDPLLVTRRRVIEEGRPALSSRRDLLGLQVVRGQSQICSSMTIEDRAQRYCSLPAVGASLRGVLGPDLITQSLSRFRVAKRLQRPVDLDHSQRVLATILEQRLAQFHSTFFWRFARKHLFGGVHRGITI